MTSRELEKKIAAVDKKLKKTRLPHGEGTIFWKRKKSCYLGHRKMISYPDGTSERHTVYEYDLEPLFALIKRDTDNKQEQRRLNHMSSQSVKSHLNNDNVILSDAIKHWFYKFRYLNRRDRTFGREESILKNQVLNHPSLCNAEIQTITDTIIQDHITELMKSYPYSTVEKTYELLN